MAFDPLNLAFGLSKRLRKTEAKLSYKCLILFSPNILLIHHINSNYSESNVCDVYNKRKAAMSIIALLCDANVLEIQL